ncbi:hypothetical protein BKA70DRAFT_776918 [Coprinopsis sp. MPI-PUGE-AT-0042]|nr:hypothetical protein BKA70DRAFT_776918 [Coprinopsis sp. MPI-PUGE-AT-0042]
MADNTTTRPRPRPRPRPVPKTSPRKASPTTGTATSGATPGPSTETSRARDDIDDMFIKNKNRDLNTWKKLDTAKKDEITTHNDDDSESDSDENLSPNSRKRRREKSSSLPKPKWQRDKDFMRTISDVPKALSDSDDSDLEILEEGSAAPQRPKQRGSKRAKRSRSRSITPPPQLPLQQIENVRRVVWKAMGSKPTPGPSAEEDDGYLSSEPLELDPELERITRQVQREASSVTPGFGAPTQPRGASARPDGDDDDVQVRVRWKPHPNAPNQAEGIEWEYKISRSDDFYDLFEAIAEDAQIRAERLVVCYDGKRIFASVTPSTLSLWRSADFDAYEKTVYDYIRLNPELRYANGLNATQPQTQSSSKANNGKAIELSDSDDDGTRPAASPARAAPSYSSAPSSVPSSTSQAAPIAASDSEAEDDDKFKLILRSSASKDITLTVRPNTKCGSIVKAFLKRAGLEAKYAHAFLDEAQATPKPKGRGKGAKAPAPQKIPKLSVDGDKLDNDSPIGDADLEDGDLIEVVDL